MRRHRSYTHTPYIFSSQYDYLIGWTLIEKSVIKITYAINVYVRPYLFIYLLLLLASEWKTADKWVGAHERYSHKVSTTRERNRVNGG